MELRLAKECSFHHHSLAVDVILALVQLAPVARVMSRWTPQQQQQQQQQQQEEETLGSLRHGQVCRVLALVALLSSIVCGVQAIYSNVVVSSGLSQAQGL